MKKNLQSLYYFISDYITLFKKIKLTLDNLASNSSINFTKSHNHKNFLNLSHNTVDLAKVLLLQIFTFHILLENQFITFTVKIGNTNQNQTLQSIIDSTPPIITLFNLANSNELNFYNSIIKCLCDKILLNNQNYSFKTKIKISDCYIFFIANLPLLPSTIKFYVFQAYSIYNKLPNYVFSNKEKEGILDVLCLYNYFIPEYFDNILKFVQNLNGLPNFIQNIFSHTLKTKFTNSPINNHNTKINNTNSIDCIEALGKICEEISCVNENNFSEFINSKHKLINKKTGSFYTPSEIIYLICSEAINIYLANKFFLNNQCVNNTCQQTSSYSSYNIYNLIETLNKNDLKNLYKVLNYISICDFSCGSGDFLLFALEILVFYKFLIKNKLKRITYNAIYYIINEDYYTQIKNIYGVEINFYGYLTTLLRLWLKSLGLYKQKINKLNNDHSKFKFKSSYNHINHYIINADALSHLQEYQKYFPHIFSHPQNAGFDIIITNPPYIGEKGNKELFSKLRQNRFTNFYFGRCDIYYFFIHQALNLLKPQGIAGLITPNYFTTATCAHNLRKDIKNRSNVKKIINFNDTMVFKNLSTHTMIIFLEKKDTQQSSNINLTSNLSSNTVTHSDSKSNEICHLIVINKSLYDKELKLASKKLISINNNKILNILNSSSTQIKLKQSDIFYGTKDYILSNLPYSNDEYVQKICFSILEKIKSSTIHLSDFCNVNQGIITGADKITSIHLKKHPNIYANVGDGIFIISKEELENLNLLPYEQNYIKPWYKNSSISRWFTINTTKEFIIYLQHTPIDISNSIPNIISHLQKYKQILENRREVKNGSRRWYELWWSRDEKIFKVPKIVVPHRSLFNKFGYTELDWYASADVYFITSKTTGTDLKYFLALLNSPIYYLWFYIYGKRKGQMLELYQVPLCELPIKIGSESLRNQIVINVEKLLSLIYAPTTIPSLTKDNANLHTFYANNFAYLEFQINELIYDLFELSSMEKELLNKFFIDFL